MCSKQSPGEEDLVYEYRDIIIDLCNYTDHERLLSIDERNRRHAYVVGIKCNLRDIGYIRKSGFTASEAMQTALEVLGCKLQLHS